MPSRRWQIWATAGAFRSVTRKAGSTARARSMKRRTASAPRRPRAVGAGAAARLRQLGQGQRRDPPGGLAGDAEGLAAGGQQAHPGALLEDGVHEPGAGLDDVLAVVQEEERVALLEQGDERRLRGLAGALPRPHRGQRGARDERRVGGGREGREVDEPHAVGDGAGATGHGLEGESGLAHAPRAGQRHQRARGEQAPDLRELPLAPDEAGELHGQVGGVGVRRAQGETGAGPPGRGTPPAPDRRLEPGPVRPREPQGVRQQRHRLALRARAGRPAPRRRSRPRSAPPARRAPPGTGRRPLGGAGATQRTWGAPRPPRPPRPPSVLAPPPMPDALVAHRRATPQGSPAGRGAATPPARPTPHEGGCAG